jgi:predicted DNA-binding protein (MmcQ/YjbR family)
MNIFEQPNEKVGTESKNFMIPQEVQNQQILKKREEYAASLRKQKTKQILT